MKYFHHLATLGVLMGVAAVCGHSTVAGAADLVHDSEYYVLEEQNGEAWAADDKAVDARLAEFRQTNGGKPPNILYILIGDIGFGDLGIPELNAFGATRLLPSTSLRMKVCGSPACTPSPPAHRRVSLS